MPRPVSWLPRLHEIARSVANSVRSHYDRRDLEALFELQPRAAQKLLEMLPTVQVGTSSLVDREVLASFLERVREADDVTSLFDQVRSEKPAVSRKKLRSLVRRDDRPIGIGSLPEAIALSRGRLEVSFSSIEQLAESLYALVRVFDNDQDAFVDAYEPERPPAIQEEAGEIDAMFAELEALERDRAAHPKLSTL